VSRPTIGFRHDLRKHASRLLAIALTARDKGQIEYADMLTEQASSVLDITKTLELVRQRHAMQK
jgi:hypothetical protein